MSPMTFTWELRTPEDVTGAADLKAGDYVGVSAELKGTWATREEFVAACRPVIEAARATGVRDPYISLYMRESRIQKHRCTAWPWRDPIRRI